MRVGQMLVVLDTATSARRRSCSHRHTVGNVPGSSSCQRILPVRRSKITRCPDPSPVSNRDRWPSTGRADACHATSRQTSAGGQVASHILPWGAGHGHPHEAARLLRTSGPATRACAAHVTAGLTQPATNRSTNRTTAPDPADLDREERVGQTVRASTSGPRGASCSSSRVSPVSPCSPCLRNHRRRASHLDPHRSHHGSVGGQISFAWTRSPRKTASPCRT